MRVVSMIILIIWIIAVLGAADGQRTRVAFIMALSLLIPLIYIIGG